MGCLLMTTFPDKHLRRPVESFSQNQYKYERYRCIFQNPTFPPLFGQDSGSLEAPVQSSNALGLYQFHSSFHEGDFCIPTNLRVRSQRGSNPDTDRPPYKHLTSRPRYKNADQHYAPTDNVVHRLSIQRRP